MSITGKRYLVAAIVAVALLGCLYAYQAAMSAYVHRLLVTGAPIISPVRTLVQVGGFVHQWWWPLALVVTASCFYVARLTGQIPSILGRGKAYAIWLMWAGFVIGGAYVLVALVGQEFMERTERGAPIPLPLRALFVVASFLFACWWVLIPLVVLCCLGFAGVLQSARKQTLKP